MDVYKQVPVQNMSIKSSNSDRVLRVTSAGQSSVALLLEDCDSQRHLSSFCSKRQGGETLMDSV